MICKYVPFLIHYGVLWCNKPNLFYYENEENKCPPPVQTLVCRDSLILYLCQENVWMPEFYGHKSTIVSIKTCFCVV